MQTIAIINLKGGNGKTTTAVEMLYLLAEKHGKRVLGIDNDKQGNLSKAFQVFDAVFEDGSSHILETQNIEGNIEHTKFQNIDIAPCNLHMQLVERKILLDQIHSQHERYKNALESVQANYDYCIIDNPPDLGICVVNALVASNRVIIPVNLDDYSLDGLGNIVEQIEQIKQLNPKLEIAGCLICDYEKNEMAIAAEKWLREFNQITVFDTVIRHSKKAKEATFHHIPVSKLSNRSAIAQGYRKFVEEYLLSFAEI